MGENYEPLKQTSAMGKYKAGVGVCCGGRSGREKLSFFRTGQISCLGIPGGGKEVVKCELEEGACAYSSLVDKMLVSKPG